MNFIYQSYYALRFIEVQSELVHVLAYITTNVSPYMVPLQEEIPSQEQEMHFLSVFIAHSIPVRSESKG